MAAKPRFDEVLDAVDHLDLDEQAELVAVVQRRLAEEGRKRVIAEVREAESEFAGGQGVTGSVEELMREIRP